MRALRAIHKAPISDEADEWVGFEAPILVKGAQHPGGAEGVMARSKALEEEAVLTAIDLMRQGMVVAESPNRTL